MIGTNIYKISGHVVEFARIGDYIPLTFKDNYFVDWHEKSSFRISDDDMFGRTRFLIIDGIGYLDRLTLTRGKIKKARLIKDLNEKELEKYLNKMIKRIKRNFSSCSLPEFIDWKTLK